MSEPLEGMRVLDITYGLQGPTACVYLADMGADVIHVERPEGDVTRFVRGLGNYLPQSCPAPYFVANSRGKRCVVVDLGWDKGREVIYRLVKKCDVVVSNWRQGVMEKLGLGYEDVKKHNPGIIWARGSGFGSKGPDAAKTMLDGAGQARGGINSVTGEVGGPPLTVGAAICDMAGGMQLVIGIMTALVARERYGIGQKVETSSYGGQLWLQMWEIDHQSMTGYKITRQGRSHPMGAGAGTPGIWQTADNHAICLQFHNTEDCWQAFCKFAGMEEVGTDPRWNTLRKRMGQDSIESAEIAGQLRPYIEKAFKGKTLDQWVEFLDTQPDIVYEKVYDYEDVLNDPQAVANEYIVEMDLPTVGPKKVIGNLIQLSDTPGSVKGPPPEFSQHTEEILLELGYSWDEIAAINEHNKEVMRQKWAELGLEPPY